MASPSETEPPEVDARTIIPAAVLTVLANRVHDTREEAAKELQCIVEGLAAATEQNKVAAVIKLLTEQFVKSGYPNRRKGGFIGLYAVAAGLRKEAPQFHLREIVLPVLDSLLDQDSSIRFYACQALYNITRVARGNIIIFFCQIFNALCEYLADSDAIVQRASCRLDRLIKDIVAESDPFSLEEFITLLRARMNVSDLRMHQFLLGWINFLDGSTTIDIIGFLPRFLEGLFNMSNNSSDEVRHQADTVLTEFFTGIKKSPNSVDFGHLAEVLVKMLGSPEECTRFSSITWIHELLKVSGETGHRLVPYFVSILDAILTCMSDKEEKIRKLSCETNQVLHTLYVDQSINIDAILSVVKRQLNSECEVTRIEAFHWINSLLKGHQYEVISNTNEIFDLLLWTLLDTSDEVVLLALDLHGYLLQNALHLRQLVEFLVSSFRSDRELLQKRSGFIVSQLCVRSDPELVYRKFSIILEEEGDIAFASMMIQELHDILLGSPELIELRKSLRRTFENEDKDLFRSLYSSWRHSPASKIGLCLLAQEYYHACSIIESLQEVDINDKFLIELDNLIHHLEAPAFASLRLQLLEPEKYKLLLKSLYGLLGLFPRKSAGYKLLKGRLDTVRHQGISL